MTNYIVTAFNEEMQIVTLCRTPSIRYAESVAAKWREIPGYTYVQVYID